MPIYEFAKEKIRPLRKITFGQMQMHERRDLQRLLRENISVIAPDTLVIAEEFRGWDESRRRIDLLGIDRDANLVVFELKRTEDGGHMELQAIRYAAMVSTMTFDQAVDAFDRYLDTIGKEEMDARTEILNFLDLDEPDEDAFAQDVQIVLVSDEFSLELTTSVLWLERAIDIRCVRLQFYDLDGRVLVDVQQIIPLTEAVEYQVKVREKARKKREARSVGADYTRYDLTLGDQKFTDEFKRRASEARTNQGRRFDKKRFFCDEGELVQVNGHTYAFSNQWGNLEWQQVMTNLRDAFPDHRIAFSPSE